MENAEYSLPMLMGNFLLSLLIVRYTRAEGCGIVVLETLEDALRSHHRILSVIKGCAQVHDGRSAGLTAPNGTSQVRVMQEALADAGANPSEVFQSIHELTSQGHLH